MKLLRILVMSPIIFIGFAWESACFHLWVGKKVSQWLRELEDIK